MQYNLSGLTFLIWLFAEIAGFILVGRIIGVLPTLALLLLAMVAGFALLRHYGENLMTQLQNQFLKGTISQRTAGEGALIITAAILLIIPGFFSDIAGLLLLVPPVRAAVWRFLEKQRQNSRKTGRGRRTNKTAPPVIDLDAEDYHATDPKHSPWRQDNDHHNKNR